VTHARQHTSAQAGTAATTGATSADVPLRSLTPQYVEEDHGTYLRRLEEAVKDPNNLNIALTGRYGAGKSSVLEEFRGRHGKSVEQLAISTLAPGAAGETRTNRIQKAIVQQLLYGATQKVGRNSRFSRIAVLSRPRALGRALVVVACLAAPVYFFDLFPTPRWAGPDEPWWQQAAVWGGLFLVSTVVVSLLLRAVRGRWVSDVTAGPAAVSLSEKSVTPFDKFTDEIVHYFDSESKDIVVIEDLDRFEDPHIFESLRELNLLLNNTPKRRAKRRGNRPGRVFRWLLDHVSKTATAKLTERLPFPWATRILGLGVPLRFVYAVKDSVFEKLDTETANAAASPAGDSGDRDGAANDGSGTAAAVPGRVVDAAVAETQRANRTKFFDVVIPLVPFISHRNARELLKTVLEEAGVTDIDRKLINVVARHTTDMRLLRNMCNEYLLFAERLLEGDTVAPNLDHNKVFALVAYKNFHLSDFENIARGDSLLDRLYDLHQQMVRESITAAEQAKSAQRSAPTRVRERDERARHLGARLGRYADAELRTFMVRNSGRNHVCFQVGGTVHDRAASATRQFWEAVAQSGKVTVLAASNAGGAQPHSLTTLERDDLRVIVPEALTADGWAHIDTSGTDADIAAHDADIQALRRADFADLAAMRRFTLVPTASPTPGTGPGTTPTAASQTPAERGTAASDAKTFAELITDTLTSKLACDLVTNGYIDRNFSLYAAQFYGHFSGTDVALFMVRHVQPNKASFYYNLRRPGAVASVLTDAADAGEDLLRTVAAYNIDLANHLLRTGHEDTWQLIDTLIAGLVEPDNDASSFLAAYLHSEDAERDKLVTLLAERRWRQTFTHLVISDQVPDNARTELVSAALTGADPQATYDLGDDVRKFIVDHYNRMPAVTEPHDDRQVDRPEDRVANRVDTVLNRAQVILPDLTDVSDQLLRLIVSRDAYDLTADNIRMAADLTGEITLDEVSRNDKVYNFCLTNLGGYLNAVDHDPATDYTVRQPATLLTVLGQVATRADVDPNGLHLGDLLAKADPDARQPTLSEAPQDTWEALAAAGLFRASLANIEAYRATSATGNIDDHLAKLIADAGAIHLDEPQDTLKVDGEEVDRTAAAIAILNTPAIGDPTIRVTLVEGLNPAKPLATASIHAEPSDLFALLLTRGLVEDDAASFTHFRAWGWVAIGPAIAASTNIVAELEPDHVHGLVVDLFNDPDARNKLGDKVASDLDTYVPDDGQASTAAALLAGAEYAHAHNIALRVGTVKRIADAATSSQAPIVLGLLANAYPAANGEDVIGCFGLLGHPYDQIKTKDKFHIPKDGAGVNKALLDKLDDRYKVRQRPRKEEWLVSTSH
jgi:hypothetical protein